MKKMKKIQSILYVEDEITVQEELSEFLKDYCDELYVASNGVEGLSLFKQHHPKIIVSDIKMPKMDGIELAQEIFKIDPECHIIFTTAFTDMKYLQDAITLHAAGYIVKPIDLEHLEHMLLKVIKIESLQKQLEIKTQYELKKKAELETILATTLDGIVILDLSMNFSYINSAFEKTIGYSFQKLKQKSMLDILNLESRKKFKQYIDHVINGDPIENFEIKCITHENKKIILSFSLALMPDKNRILLSTKDVTKEILAHRKILEYVDIIDENIITSSTDLQGKITYTSEAFCKISGYTKQELMGQCHNIVRNDDVSPELYKSLWEDLEQNKVWSGEIKNKNKKGEEYWVFVKIYPVFDQDGIKIGYTSIRHDITNLKKVEELSIVDSLTQIYNRHHFNQTFDPFIQSAKRTNELVSFAIFDIDYFKQYNDTYGHQKGDYALQAVAKALKNALNRADDYLFRLGGEEFGVLFKSNTKACAIDFINSLIKQIEELKIEHSQNTISKYVTISAGLISKSANEIIDEDTLYKETDELLYKAKHNGRNQVIYNKEI